MNENFCININDLKNSKKLSQEEIKNLNEILNSEKELILEAMKKFKLLKKSLIPFFIFFLGTMFFIGKILGKGEYSEFFIYFIIAIFIIIVSLYLFYYRKTLNSIIYNIKNNLGFKLCYLINENFIFLLSNKIYKKNFKKKIYFLKEKNFLKKFNSLDSEDFLELEIEKNSEKIKIIGSEILKFF